MGGMQWRTVTLVGALSLAIGWAMGGGLASQRSGSQPRANGRGARPLGVEQSKDTAPLTRQLRLKLDQQPARPQPFRNPFVFGSRPPAAAPASRPSPATADPVADAADADAPERPVAPAFTLSGMASTESPDGPAFTAIISNGQGLLFVKVGDSLPGGYVVADVQENMVTLKDSSGGERTLRLR
jgi:hypothetical protein